MVKDPWDFDEELIEEEEGVRPTVKDLLVEEPEPPPPESKLSRPLRKKIGKGPYKEKTPVAVRLELADIKAAEENFNRSAAAGEIRHQIPTFGVYSGNLPNDTIYSMEDDVGVRRVFFDAQVPFPGPPVSRPSQRGVADRPFQLGANVRSIRSQLGQFMPNVAGIFTGGLAGTKPLSEGLEAGWIPTSLTREILGANRARSEGVEGTGVKVAVLDTGVPIRMARTTHPQLGLDVEAQYWTRVPLPDRSGHGTHVAGIIGGREWTAPNGTLLEGMAPGVTLTGIKVLETPLGIGRDSDILKGLEMAMEWGAQIVNMSLGSEGYDPDNMYEEPFAKMVQEGIIPIVAVGNSGPEPGTVGTPAGSLNCIAVGSVNSATGKPANFSSRGPTGYTGTVKPDVVSLGGDLTTGHEEKIYSSTSLGSTLDKLDRRPADRLSPAPGTSQATPHFAGIVALWADWAKQNLTRDLNFKDVQFILSKKGHPANNDVGVGMAVYDWVKVLGGR